MTSAARRYGLEGPRDQSRPAPSDGPLRQAFEKWLELPPSPVLPVAARYQRALALLDGRRLQPDPEEALAVLGPYADHPRFPDAGLFLSACYARSSSSSFLYRPLDDLPIAYVGYRLPAGKALSVPREARATKVGLEAAGTILNSAGAVLVGNGATGLVVNAWDPSGFAGTEVEVAGAGSTGLVLNTGTTQVLGGVSTTGIFVNAGDAEEMRCDHEGMLLPLRPPSNPTHLYTLQAVDFDRLPALGAFLRGLADRFSLDKSAEEHLAEAAALDIPATVQTIRRLARTGGRS